MVKKLTNKELITNLNGLNLFQIREQKYLEQVGKKLLTGKFNIAYAINKNKGKLDQALKPYNETMKEILEEYNSEDAKKKGNVKIKEGKEQEWEEAVKQLQEQETEVEIHTVKLKELENLDMDSTDLSCLEFMIE